LTTDFTDFADVFIRAHPWFICYSLIRVEFRDKAVREILGDQWPARQPPGASARFVQVSTSGSAEDQT
jgi:hypothetical protein